MKFIWRTGTKLVVFGCLLMGIQGPGWLHGAGFADEPIGDRFPVLSLPGSTRGEAAITALGAQLAEVAAAHAMDSEELRSLLRRDASAGIDRRGRLFYSDAHLPQGPAQGAAPGEAAAGGGLVAPLADTFKLHSKPGAQRTIFLDFDGQVITGSVWNDDYAGGQPIVAPAWDIEGGPNVFTDGERTLIQRIWRRVAEDFAAFDVDVTTECADEALLTRSSSADAIYGVRVLVSPISGLIGPYGGYAYYCFNSIGDYYKPALVFPENLAQSEKYIAECASHEVGHTLGLSHDGLTTGEEYYKGHGSGETGWAPIMGSGYYKHTTHWSKGEYANANNKQDDFAVMQTWGVALRTDDVGNTPASASFLTAGNLVVADGLIERAADVDMIGFATDAGAISLTVAPVSLGGNVDVALRLLNSEGQEIATGAPAGALAASVGATVPAGTYYLEVRGSGNGDLVTGYSNYGSVGQYTVTANLIDPTGHVAPVAVASADRTSGEAPLPVQFSSSDSFDLDGSIVGWLWNFGDGTTSTLANPAHTFGAAGSYSVTLTVTDNNGLTDSAALAIGVTSQDLTKILRVGSITLSVVTTTRDKQVRATVRVTDAAGNVVPGATVSGSFSGVAASSASASSDVAGNAILNSKRFRKSGAVTFTVTGIAKSGSTYDATRNAASSATISVR